jgi:hypothetical protein
VRCGQVAWLAICWLVLAGLSFAVVYNLRGSAPPDSALHHG